jgi:hypothetical protein
LIGFWQRGIKNLAKAGTGHPVHLKMTSCQFGSVISAAFGATEPS